MRAVCATAALVATLLCASPAAAESWVLWEWTYLSNEEQADKGGKTAQLRRHKTTGVYPSSYGCLAATRTRGREYAADLSRHLHGKSADLLLTVGEPVESSNPPGVRIEAQLRSKTHSRAVLFILKTQCWPAGVTPR